MSEIPRKGQQGEDPRVNSNHRAQKNHLASRQTHRLDPEVPHNNQMDFGRRVQAGMTEATRFNDLSNMGERQSTALGMHPSLASSTSFRERVQLHNAFEAGAAATANNYRQRGIVNNPTSNSLVDHALDHAMNSDMSLLSSSATGSSVSNFPPLSNEHQHREMLLLRQLQFQQRQQEMLGGRRGQMIDQQLGLVGNNSFPTSLLDSMGRDGPRSANVEGKLVENLSNIRPLTNSNIGQDLPVLRGGHTNNKPRDNSWLARSQIFAGRNVGSDVNRRNAAMLQRDNTRGFVNEQSILPENDFLLRRQMMLMNPETRLRANNYMQGANFQLDAERDYLARKSLLQHENAKMAGYSGQTYPMDLRLQNAYQLDPRSQFEGKLEHRDSMFADRNSSRGHAIQDQNMDDRYDMIPEDTPLLLSTEKDSVWLSDLLCLVRAQIELFTATATDVAARSRRGGMQQPLVVGRVGIRCIHCKHLAAEDRAKGAVSYPNSIRIVHQSVRNWQRYHFMDCQCIPASIRELYMSLKERRNHSGNASLQYWINSCEAFGLIDTDSGIRYVSNAKRTLNRSQVEEMNTVSDFRQSHLITSQVLQNVQTKCLESTVNTSDIIDEKFQHMVASRNRVSSRSLIGGDFDAEAKEKNTIEDLKERIDSDGNDGVNTILNSSRPPNNEDKLRKRDRSCEEESVEKPEKKKKKNGDVSDAAIALCSLE
jgi:hypothetical protein